MSSARGTWVLVGCVALAACAGRSSPRTSGDAVGIDLRELWIEPANLHERDLFNGPGGEPLAPDADTAYEFVSVDRTGYSPGYDVRDPSGKEWSVKLGPEAQPEVVASRVLWAIGFHQPATYYLPSWKLSGKMSGVQPAGRFRYESPAHKPIAEWSWYENPFAATQPFRGLIVANLILNNWDWKTSNNRVYESDGTGDGPRRIYIVRDLGAALGKTTFPRFLRWTPMRGMGQGTRNDLAGFEEQGFIKAVDGTRVRFHYRGIYQSVVDVVTVDDVVWTCRRLAKLSDQQWDDAFRAAGYGDDHRQRFIRKLKAKIVEGTALASSSAAD